MTVEQAAFPIQEFRDLAGEYRGERSGGRSQ